MTFDRPAPFAIPAVAMAYSVNASTSPDPTAALLSRPPLWLTQTLTGVRAISRQPSLDGEGAPRLRGVGTVSVTVDFGRRREEGGSYVRELLRHAKRRIWPTQRAGRHGSDLAG
jgi:hypothetical protein